MLRLMPSQKQSPSVFGSRLIAARRSRGITQVQLAQSLGMTQAAISYYEAEGGNPPLDVVVKLATALNTSADDLLGITKPIDGVPVESTDERRLWRRFRQLLTLPEKDRRAVLRMLDSLAKNAEPTTKAG